VLGAQFVREHPDVVRRSLERRHTEAPLDEALELDVRRRTILTQLEKLRADRNEAGKAIGKAQDDAERQRLIDSQRDVADRIDALEADLREVEPALTATLAEIPSHFDGVDLSPVLLHGADTAHEDLYHPSCDGGRGGPGQCEPGGSLQGNVAVASDVLITLLYEKA